eukprot:5853331-Amphidinium_carterae.1
MGAKEEKPKTMSRQSLLVIALKTPRHQLYDGAENFKIDNCLAKFATCLLDGSRLSRPQPLHGGDYFVPAENQQKRP